MTIKSCNDFSMVDMHQRLTEYLNRPIRIGNRRIDKRLIMAPMTFLGHVALRRVIGEFGGFGLLWTEMCNAKRVPTENRTVSPYFCWQDTELPYLVCQIFGADPEHMAAAAQRIEAEGFFGVDVNFGCSVKTICSQNCGAALLRDPNLAETIVAAIRKAVSIPVWVKFRTGWQDDPSYAVDLARRFEAAGADALIFHPRVSPDRRSRPPTWAYIGMVKESVSIPVFGNGNVFDERDCLHMLDSTGCDGVALGRLAVARPWVFAAWTTGLPVTPDLYLTTIRRVAGFLREHFGEDRALSRFRKLSLYYSANFRYGHTLYSSIMGAGHMAAAEDALQRFFESPPELNRRPNMNFFN
ncbi:tRNA-dihydrouridine synthase DVU0661 [Olavius algarvensis associated proteobacterium Delta 3]|nr:tRNA-dihydrouridine synthase DVU0661 [Olavius algarvensis associated proteobacterium Delta 3]CAB5157773.1 tRNA-dihydrouridine synthase DVU0661 [Olavius algarvensis associated proteobacterium Delta 3]